MMRDRLDVRLPVTRERPPVRAILWARLALRINRPEPGKDRLLGAGEAAAGEAATSY
jgi:hypothetical protein